MVLFTLKFYFTIFLFGIFLTACSQKILITKIHEGPVLKVHLQQVPSDQDFGDPPYQHPLSLTPSEITQILKSLLIHHPERKTLRLFLEPQPDEGPVFFEREIKILSGPFSKALNEADSRERIHFQLEHRHGVFRGGLTSGVIFIQENRLHFILGNYRYIPSVKRADIYRSIDDRLHSTGFGVNHPLDTRDIGSASLIPGPFQSLHPTQEVKLKERWLTIDYSGLLDHEKDAIKSEKKPIQEERALTYPSETSTSTLPKEDLKKRLETLKQWWEEGLITEEEYSQKKKELLKEF